MFDSFSIFFFVFSLIHTTISFVLRDCCYVRTLCFNNFLSGMFFPVPLLVHHFSNLFNKAFNFNEMERSLLYNGLDSVRNCVWIYDFPVYLQSNQTLRCKSPVWCSLMFTYGLNKHFSFATIWKIIEAILVLTNAVRLGKVIGWSHMHFNIFHSQCKYLRFIRQKIFLLCNICI